MGLVCALWLAFSTQAFPATDDLNNVELLQHFYGDEDQGQCGYRQFSDIISGKFGKWTEPVYINTDNRRGGCVQSFAILDPLDALHSLSITVELSSFATVPQCDSKGASIIPKSRDMVSLRWTEAYRIDTDDGDTGCSLRFSLEGRDDIALDVEFKADGVPEQCMNPGQHTVDSRHSVELRIKTDERPGGCYLRLRLRSAQSN
jgi:hypothetical protein